MANARRPASRPRPKARPGADALTGAARRAKARRASDATAAAAAGADSAKRDRRGKAGAGKAARDQTRRNATPDVLDRFRRAHPMLWQQACRVFKVMELQKQHAGDAFPPGACFLYADLPAFDSFCVRRIHDLELDTCLVEIEIHADVGLEAGRVLLPLEHIRWFGLPTQAIPGGHPLLGFTTPGGRAADVPAPGT